MKGRLLDMAIGYNRKPRITIELDSDFREGFDALRDVDVEITIRKWRARRSKDANAYFHVLVGQIAMTCGLTDEEVKRQLVRDYGVYKKDGDGNYIGLKQPPSVDIDQIYPYAVFYKQIEENGKLKNCYLIRKRTSEMDSAEMAHLIDKTIEEARALGIDTDTPEEKARYSE